MFLKKIDKHNASMPLVPTLLTSSQNPSVALLLLAVIDSKPFSCAFQRSAITSYSHNNLLR